MGRSRGEAYEQGRHDAEREKKTSATDSFLQHCTGNENYQPPSDSDLKAAYQHGWKDEMERK